jgi:glycosyltransferase involved in cell wall biosynthesis
MNQISILSIGYTRSILNKKNTDDTLQRMLYYAEHIKKYVVVIHSYRKHKLQKENITENFSAIPTNGFSPIDSTIRMIWLGYKALKAEKFNLIQAQDPFLTGVAAIILGYLFKIPTNILIYGPNVYDLHWRSSSLLNTLIAPIGVFVLKNASSIQVDGQMTARSLENKGFSMKNIHIKPMIPSNIDAFLRVNQDKIENTSSSTVKLLFVGRLEKQKNLTMLTEVIKLLARHKYNVQINIVGEGSQKNLFVRNLYEDGILSYVHFLGYIAHENIYEVFAEADIFLMTSLYEGYPRVLMESAATGLPIVTTAISGSDEAVVNEKTGYIVPVNDVETFFNKLKILIEEPELRAKMGCAAKEHMSNLSNPTIFLDKQISIWKSYVL